MEDPDYDEVILRHAIGESLFYPASPCTQLLKRMEHVIQIDSKHIYMSLLYCPKEDEDELI